MPENVRQKSVQNDGVTDELIRFVLGIDLASVPRVVRERSKELVLDHFGVSIYGSTLEWSRKVRDMAEDEGSTGVATIYGGGKTSARNAALANGTAGHAIELDDTHDESLSHPGAVIVPAALAVAEQVQANGAEFLAAVIGGYEVQCRIGAAMSSLMVNRGFHPTAQLGVFGSAATASRLMHLSQRQTTWALGIAGSMASGIMKFTQDPEGTMVKRLHAGMAAERGIIAAQLAARNFTGPREIIERDYGYARTFVGVEDLSRITRGLGENFEVEGISVKLYPCCRMFHALIEAIERCRETRPFDARSVVRVEAFGPDNMINGHLERRPLSTMSAQFSLPFTIAVAIMADVTRPSSFEGANLGRADLLALADKAVGIVDPELQKLYPRKCPARVMIYLEDGAILEEEVLDSRSTPANPICRKEIEAKFDAVTDTFISRHVQTALKEAVFALEEADDLSTIGALLGSY